MTSPASKRGMTDDGAAGVNGEIESRRSGRTREKTAGRTKNVPCRSEVRKPRRNLHNVGQNVSVSEHRAFSDPGCAAGVLEQGEVVGRRCTWNWIGPVVQPITFFRLRTWIPS